LIGFTRASTAFSRPSKVVRASLEGLAQLALGLGQERLPLAAQTPLGAQQQPGRDRDDARPDNDADQEGSDLHRQDCTRTG
jgi:hypothetical protein